VRCRRAIIVTAAALALLPAGVAGSHPGHGPQIIEIGDFAFAPQSVNIVEGDYVLWDWAGPDTNHSVTADPGQTMTFDSDQGKSAAAVSHPTKDGFSVQFLKAGTYTYHCKVHAFMTGTIHVAALPASLKPQPLTKPRLTHVRFSRFGRAGVTLRFTVNEAVSMRAIVRRLKGSRAVGPTVKEIDFSGPPGTHRRRLELGRLRRGSYQLSIVAVDASSGDSTRPVRSRVVVR
jgi:plastocyanin